MLSVLLSHLIVGYKHNYIAQLHIINNNIVLRILPIYYILPIYILPI